MTVLVACEFSGIVRDAFLSQGHDAVSCDLIPSESSNGLHLQGDVRKILHLGWDLLIAHPPCTYLCASGARWWAGRRLEQAESVEFCKDLLDSPIPRICLENPVGCLSRLIRPSTQIIQPWMFGHGEIKTTCLWLKSLPKLLPTQIVSGRDQICWKMSRRNGFDRGKARSRTYSGIALAMAEQWGK